MTAHVTTATGPVAVIGFGLIGQAVARLLRRTGIPVITVARARGTVRLDIGEPTRRQELVGLLQGAGARSVVLTHGPSDVTWCEENSAAALAMHQGVAEAVSGAGCPVILVSTDNVFDGSAPRNSTADPVNPQNAYGRAKLAAEQCLLATPGNVVLRVSLVYGWSDGQHRRNFAERCLLAARAAQELAVPTDQEFTPVHVDDVARVVAAVALTPASAPPLAHVAGPEHLSRAEFARAAYQAAGADPSLVVGVPRSLTTWASRPAHSSLANSDLSQVSGLAGYQPMTPAQGLDEMVRTAGPRIDPQASARPRPHSGQPRVRFGIDAGGSHTRIEVVHPVTGAHKAVYPSINPASVGAEQARSRLRDVLAFVKQIAGDLRADGWLGSAAVCAPTAPEQLGLIAAAAEDVGLGVGLTVSGDVLPLLLAPPLHGAGSVVVVGTGSGIFAGDGTGQVLTGGGYEYLASDEGSAFDLGLAGLRAAGRARDQTAEPTALLPAFEEYFGADFPTVARRLAENPHPKSAVAALARVVCQAWAAGDAVAAALGEDAARRLATTTAQLRRAAHVPAQSGTVLTGGMVTGSDRFAAALATALRDACGDHPITIHADATAAALSLVTTPPPAEAAKSHRWVLEITGKTAEVDMDVDYGVHA